MKKIRNRKSSGILLLQAVGVSYNDRREHLHDRIYGKTKTVLCGNRMSEGVEQAYLFPPRNRLFLMFL